MNNVDPKQNSFFAQLAAPLIWLSLAWVCLQVALGPYGALYIADNIVWLVSLAGFVCFAAGMFQLTSVLLHPAGRGGGIIALAIFLLPLALLLTVTPRAFGAATLHQSGGVVQIADFGADTSATPATTAQPTIEVVDLSKPGSSQPLPEPSKYGDVDADGIWTPNLIQISLLLQDQPSEAVSRTLNTIGFVYRAGDLPAHSFILTRYATIHCAAEARAIGILVSAPEADNYAEGDWVTVSGKVAQVTVGSKRQPQINAQTIAPSDAPVHPYLFYTYYAPPARQPNTNVNRP